MMRMLGYLAGLCAIAAPVSVMAQSDFVDETQLKHCVVLKTTSEDRLVLGRWLAATLGTAPQVSDVVQVNQEARDAVNRQFALTFTRLATRDCLKEVKALGPGGTVKAFEIVGEALGELGVEELMTDPAANEAMGAFAQYLNEDDFVPLK